MAKKAITWNDFESRQAFVRGLVVKENSSLACNWRSDNTLNDYLESQGVPGLEGIDTRALVKHLRERGTMRGVLGNLDENTLDELIGKANDIPKMQGQDLSMSVSAGHIYHWSESELDLDGESLFQSRPDEFKPFHVVVVDFGVKRNILRQLINLGCRVTVVPNHTKSSDILDLKADGVLLSNGPGDPEPLGYAVRTVKELLGKTPVFGICLGHQILGLALGGKSYKLKFGHRGANHPVKNLVTNKVEITAHNHGFSLDAESFLNSDVELTHVNLNDGTVEGLRSKDFPAFSVQYHPEASPGPHDANYLFRSFVSLMQDFAASKTEGI